MTKKRRTKAQSLEEGESRDGEQLSEDHTVADSITTFDDEFAETEEDTSIEELLETGSTGDNSQVAAASRRAKAVDVLSMVQDLLTEKRSAKREAGLKRIFRAVTQYSDLDTLAPYHDDLLQFCSLSLRGGSPAEQYAACRVLEATAVVLGADRDEYFEAIVPIVKRVIMAANRATMVRGAALRALTLANFVCCTDDVSTEALLDLCEEVAAVEYRNHEVPAGLRATAMDCWSLLATTIHDFYLSGGSDDHIGRGVALLPLIQECLESSSLELRAAAGECMSLIHESRLSLEVEDGENVTERKYAQGGWEGTKWEPTIDEISQRISELSNQSGHAISKKAKKQQRATFREFLATVMDDESPDHTVSFRGGTLTLTSWRAIVQLNFVRHCLQGGFQIQLLTNPTLQTIFGADGHVLNSNVNLSQVEKRIFQSKTSEASKLAHLDRTKKRRVRTNVKNHFLTADGVDI